MFEQPILNLSWRPLQLITFDIMMSLSISSPIVSMKQLKLGTWPPPLAAPEFISQSLL